MPVGNEIARRAVCTGASGGRRPNAQTARRQDSGETERTGNASTETEGRPRCSFRRSQPSWATKVRQREEAYAREGRRRRLKDEGGSPDPTPYANRSSSPAGCRAKQQCGRETEAPRPTSALDAAAGRGVPRSGEAVGAGAPPGLVWAVAWKVLGPTCYPRWGRWVSPLTPQAHLVIRGGRATKGGGWPTHPKKVVRLHRGLPPSSCPSEVACAAAASVKTGPPGGDPRTPLEQAAAIKPLTNHGPREREGKSTGLAVRLHGGPASPGATQ